MFKKLLTAVLTLLLLASCANTPEKLLANKTVKYSEPGNKHSFSVTMDCVYSDSAKYYFEPNVEESERDACVKATEKVLSSQTAKGKTEIYIFSPERYDSKYVDGNKLYASVRDWKSTEYITDVLLACYGGSPHYGTVFGYANYLYETFEWGNGIDGKFTEPSLKDVLDLTYLCFDENFVSSDDLMIAKEISCDFVNRHIDRLGEKSLQKLLSSKNNDSLKEYYSDNGVSHTPSRVAYGYGGVSFDYIVLSGYGTFYIENGWVDSNAKNNPLISDGFLHSNYTDTKAFFEINIEQMGQYQELFKLGKYNNDLKIVFSGKLAVSQYSFYQKNNHTIYLYNVDSLMHEYIHSLAKPTSTMETWKIEGFARYYSYRYDYYGLAFLNEDYNNTGFSAATRFVREYLANINRPIDMSIDYPELENIAVYSRSYTHPSASYVAGSSFVQYLVKQYGDKAVINYIYGNGKSLPKKYDELVEDWNEFIESNYSSYSKYK